MTGEDDRNVMDLDLPGFRARVEADTDAGFYRAIRLGIQALEVVLMSEEAADEN